MYILIFSQSFISHSQLWCFKKNVESSIKNFVPRGVKVWSKWIKKIEESDSQVLYNDSSVFLRILKLTFVVRYEAISFTRISRFKKNLFLKRVCVTLNCVNWKIVVTWQYTNTIHHFFGSPKPCIWPICNHRCQDLKQRHGNMYPLILGPIWTCSLDP